jgi:hypothetical protein
MARRQKLIPDEEPKAAPVEEDLRHDNLEFDPNIEPRSAKAWLNLLQESEDAFDDWHARCDNIDKQYANLARLADMHRDKEFQMFWSNAEVIKPSIYAKPPQPVVTPKFKDRRPVYQAASELAERCAVVSFDLAEIDELMKLVRDDLALIDRGVAWCRYESGKGGSYYNHEKVCIDFKNRRDFLHSVSRNWREVTWVAAASYLTRAEARKRFYRTSKTEYQNAEYKVDRDAKEIGGADRRERAKFWEIWDKGSRRVVWVAQGCELILDEDDPHLDLRAFFPCPKPAYGTVQRGSLVPVPDVLQYRDQLEELNLLTGRIHALSDALEAKGFYPSGGAEIADAVQAAIQHKTSHRMLVPISNWAAFGGSKEVIIWLPIDMIATTIQALVLLRKQIIEDIYQIMGISDIMRGATDPNETLGAQQLKTQNGSTRIRDKQQELVRLARDLVEITLEIITEQFDPVTMIEMSQTQLPTQQMQQQAAQQIIGQLQQLQQQATQMQPPALPPPSSAAPGGAPNPSGGSDPSTDAPPPPAPGQDAQGQMQQQMQAQAQDLMRQLQKLREQPTIEQVLHFLKSNRAKSFVLDIETDSTILADEQAEKQARTEFVSMLGGLLPQLSQMIVAEPQTADFCGELLKFATAPFRAGRQLDGAIDELVEQMKAKATQPQGNPSAPLIQIEQMKQQTARQKLAQDKELAQAEMEQKDRHKTWELNNAKEIERIKMGGKAQDDQAKMAVQNQKRMESTEAHQMDMIGKQADLQIAREKAQMTAQQAQVAAQAKQADFANRANERQLAHQQKMQMPVGAARARP